MTIRTMIQNAMQEIGALAAGEPLSDADAQAGLVRFNSLLDLWQTERLTIYDLVRFPFTVVANRRVYHLGTTAGADVNPGIRPTYIHKVCILDTDGYETELEGPLTMDEWAILGFKTLTSTVPTKWYYNPAFPHGELELWPTPTDATNQIILYLPKPLTAVANVNTTLTLAPGYEEAIRYNLALRLAPVFGRPMDPGVAAMANETKSQIKRTNARTYELRVDPALQTAYVAWDYRTG